MSSTSTLSELLFHHHHHRYRYRCRPTGRVLAFVAALLSIGFSAQADQMATYQSGQEAPIVLMADPCPGDKTGRLKLVYQKKSERDLLAGCWWFDDQKNPVVTWRDGRVQELDAAGVRFEPKYARTAPKTRSDEAAPPPPPLEGGAAEVVCRKRRKVALKAAQGGAGGADDDDGFRHEGSLIKEVTQAVRRSFGREVPSHQQLDKQLARAGQACAACCSVR